jgi:hypothetical protein
MRVSDHSPPLLFLVIDDVGWVRRCQRAFVVHTIGIKTKEIKKKKSE